jgi:transcriptional regulator with XRE-family HTH domain
MSLGARLKQRREQLGLSQVEVAELAGMRQNMISRLECGDTPNPSTETIKRLALVLKCSIDWLVGLYDAPKPEGVTRVAVLTTC